MQCLLNSDNSQPAVRKIQRILEIAEHAPTGLKDKKENATHYRTNSYYSQGLGAPLEASAVGVPLGGVMLQAPPPAGGSVLAPLALPASPRPCAALAHFS